MDAKDDIENYRLHKQIYNAYQILTTKCEKHEISSSLAAVKIGDARAAWKIINEYFVRSTPAGRAIASRAFFNSTQSSTDTTLLQWFKIVEDLAADLATARGAAVSDEEKKNLLLEGLLPEFKPKKQFIFEKGNSHTLAATKADLQDFAKQEGLMSLRRGTSQGKTHSFVVDGRSNKRKANFKSKEVPAKKTFKESLSETSCKKWAEGKCQYGDDCYRRHDGPGASLKSVPPHMQRDTNTSQSSSLPKPSVPLVTCQYCFTGGHILRECPKFILATQENSGETMFAKVTPNFSFPVVEEELPEDEMPDKSSVVIKLSFVSIIASIVLYFSGIFSELRRIIKSSVGWRGVLLLIVLTALASYAFAAPLPYVRAASYFNEGDESNTSDDFQWVADSGTNRFVTNDINDFLHGSVVHAPVKVAVGGGTTISPCSGSILVQSLDHDITIRCDDVILLPQCAKKSMPAHQFTKKGCVMEFSNGVQLRSGNGVPILSGPEIGGLFYFHARTIQSTGPRGPIAEVFEATSLFGLPASQGLTNAGADFPRRLLEAHWSFGHLKFEKLRKIFGLKAGNNPECPICTVASQKQAALANETKRKRSTRPCHRMHMDIGFTAGSEYNFSLSS